MMNTLKLVGVALIIAGALALTYGGFSYPKETQEAKIGPLEITVSEQETVNVPVWVGAAAIVGGVLLLIVPMGIRRKG